MFGFMDLVMTIVFLALYIFIKSCTKTCTHESEPEKSDNKKETENLKDESNNTESEINEDISVSTQNEDSSLICDTVKKNVRFYEQDTLSSDRRPTSIIDAQKNNLESASQQWKKRVEPSDAINYSVAGRMNQDVKLEITESVLNFANGDKKKKTPKANRFRSRDGKFNINNVKNK